MWSNWNPHALLVECKMAQPLWKTVWQFLNRLNILPRLPYDPAIPLLGLYPREMETQVHTKACTKFMGALFIIDNRWKQLSVLQCVSE